MKVLLSTLCVLTAAMSASGATIRGHLRNQTTGEPGRAESVRLLDMANELDQIGTLMNVEGEFVFEDVESRNAPPYLIQTQSGGVLYSQPVQLNQDEVTIEIAVYESDDSLEGLSFSMHHLIFERHENKLSVMEFLEVANESDPPVAIWRDNGPLTVQLPENAMEPFEVSVSTTNGTPLHQELLETDRDHVYTVPFAMKPGTTRVVIRYQLPYEGERVDYATAVHLPVQRRSVLVSPADMELHGEGLEPSDEAAPIEGYAVYLGTPMESGDTVAIELHGGSAHASDPHAGMNDDPHSGVNAVQEVERRPHRFSEQRARVMLMGGLGAILLLGLLTSSRPSTREADHDRLSELADRYAGGNIDRSEFERQLQKLRGARS